MPNPSSLLMTNSVTEASPMHILYGFDIELELFQLTTFITAMDVHSSRRGDIETESGFRARPIVGVGSLTDGNGNVEQRVTAEAGVLGLQLTGVIRDSGLPDPVNPGAASVPIAELPADALPFLAASRYCETDLLSNFAWSRFGAIPGGWAKVQAICDFVHDHLEFSYPKARETRTAWQALEERCGVCRDFAHLAVALCRCLNIPARFCNGYLGDIGVEPDPSPMDFNAWFEVFLEGGWHTFDARHNEPRIGRILISRGRDAADVAMITSFGPHRLKKFKVMTEELPPGKVTLAA
jgi:transglutaminase-like putative cysteine protease